MIRPSTLVVVVLIATTAAAADWTQIGGDGQRSSTAPAGPPDFTRARGPFAAGTDEEFVGASTPAAWNGRVFVNARCWPAEGGAFNKLIAFDARTGSRVWETPLAPDFVDSTSSPTVDARTGLVLLATGMTLYAASAADGEIAWQTPLGASVVNASAAVSDDLFNGVAPANRAFVTDYAPFGVGTLYAVNLDPRDASANPYAPGEIVWTAPLPGASGNTPTYADGVVYATSAGGSVLAFDAAGGAELWRTPASADGFFGGAALRDGHLFAATYNFFGGQNNSALFKLDAATGAVVWSVPCERTDSIPVVAADGRIFLAGGISGFGSAVKVQAFRDDGATATMLWDTFADSGGALRVGGWTAQPALAGDRLYVGVPHPSDAYQPFVALRLLDLASDPGDPAFVSDSVAGAGGPAAISGRTLFTLGAGGLYVFDSPRPADTNCDGAVNFDDIDAFVVALVGEAAYRALLPGCDYATADVNDDGAADFDDIDAFVAALIGGG